MSLALSWCTCMDYELYHDESMVRGYWHGMLLVPIPCKAQVLELLSQARREAGYFDPLSLKKVRHRGRLHDCTEAWIQVGVAALRSHTKGEPCQVFTGGRHAGGRKRYAVLCEPVGAKFIVFCERDSLARMSMHPDHGSKVETTFRMGLKGGLHFLGGPHETIHIERIHFDGHQHYHRHVDPTRIVGRLYGLRPYCSISSRPDLIDDRTSDHRASDCQHYDDCQLLQLTDLLIGCFRTALQPATNPLRWHLAYPVRQLVSRYAGGYARMRNSRWFGSFCMSECHLDSGFWTFETLAADEHSGVVQLELPLSDQ